MEETLIDNYMIMIAKKIYPKQNNILELLVWLPDPNYDDFANFETPTPIEKSELDSEIIFLSHKCPYRNHM